MDLVDDPVHDALQEVPREVEGLGRHVVRRRHGAEDDDLVWSATASTQGSGAAYIAIDSLVSHDAHGAAGVDGGIGYGIVSIFLTVIGVLM